MDNQSENSSFQKGITEDCHQKAVPFRDRLTNEEIKRPYISAFDLVNHSISKGRHWMHQGRELNFDPTVQNYAYQVLYSLANGFEDFEDEEEPNNERF